MSDIPIEPPDAYRALNGTVVAIPPPPPLADGPMPMFDASDEIWLEKLIAFRDRAIRNDRNAYERIPDNTRDMSQMDPALRQQLERGFETQRKTAKDARANLEAAKKRCDELFGPNGRGFLDALNDGSAMQNFWQSINTLMYQRIPTTQYHAPDMQIILRDLLARFPERIWLPIVAQAFPPELEHRKSDHLLELMDRFIAAPSADFRHFETGAAKPETETQLQPVMRKAVLQAAFSLLCNFATFTQAFRSMQEDPDIEEELSQAMRLADMLRKNGQTQLSDEQLDLVEELFREIQPARTYEEGQTQSEINFNIASAFDMAMQAAMPGQPEAHYLRAMLSKRPAGFTALNLSTYPREMVWPYVASHLDILDRAMGLAKPFYFEPRFERRKAIELIALLPEPPARYGDVLLEVATGPDAGGRETAQRLLAGMTDFTERATRGLTDKKAAIRSASAATLKSIADPAALPALRIQKDLERAEGAKAALEDAIGALEAATPVDIEALLSIVSEDSAALPGKMAWISDLDPPELTLADGRSAPQGFADWLLADAARHGTPSGSPRIDRHLDALSASSRAQFAAWTLQTWIAYDTQPWSDDKIDEAYESEVHYSYETYEMMWEVRDQTGDNAPEYARPTMMTKTEWRGFARERIAERAETLMNCQPYLFSAQPARGILAIAQHAPGPMLAKCVKDYLDQHGKRPAQSKALLDCLAVSNTAELKGLLEQVSTKQKQKTVRSYAAALLSKLG